MRLIDADALVKDLELMAKYQPEHKQSTILGVCATIRAKPTIDAVPVVRCKDCKHFMEFTETFRERIKFDGSCRLLVGFTDCDREIRKYTDYCSNGEHKDGARGMTHGTK